MFNSKNVQKWLKMVKNSNNLEPLINKQYKGFYNFAVIGEL